MSNPSSDSKRVTRSRSGPGLLSRLTQSSKVEHIDKNSKSLDAQGRSQERTGTRARGGLHQVTEDTTSGEPETGVQGEKDSGTGKKKAVNKLRKRQANDAKGGKGKNSGRGSTAEPSAETASTSAAVCAESAHSAPEQRRSASPPTAPSPGKQQTAAPVPTPPEPRSPVHPGARPTQKLELAAPPAGPPVQPKPTAPQLPPPAGEDRPAAPPPIEPRRRGRERPEAVPVSRQRGREQGGSPAPGGQQQQHGAQLPATQQGQEQVQPPQGFTPPVEHDQVLRAPPPPPPVAKPAAPDAPFGAKDGDDDQVRRAPPPPPPPVAKPSAPAAPPVARDDDDNQVLRSPPPPVAKPVDDGQISPPPPPPADEQSPRQQQGQAPPVAPEPLFLPEANDDDDEENALTKPVDEDQALADKLFGREDMPVDQSRPAFHEEIMDELSRNGEFDEDGAPVTLDETERQGHAKGPMSKAQRARIHEKVELFEKVMEELAEEFNRPLSAIWREARIVMRFTREPNLFNLFVKKYCLEHPQAGRSIEQVREDFVAAYHAKVDGMTKEEKAEFKKELLTWSESYDKENSKAVQEAGDLYKVVLQARLEFEELARYYYRFYDIIAVGWVVSIRPGDENALRASSAFSSTPGMANMLQKKGVSFMAVKDQIASIAKVKEMSKVDVSNFSEASQEWYMKHAKHDNVKERLSAWLIDIQNNASGRKRNKIKWTNHFIELVWSGTRITGWPGSVPIPLPDKSLFNNLEGMRTLIEVVFKTGRGELGPGKGLAVESMTEEERSWEHTRSKRKNWLDVPLYITDTGETKMTVRAALKEESVRLKKTGKHPKIDLDDGDYSDLSPEDAALVAFAAGHGARPGAKRKAAPKPSVRGGSKPARGAPANRGGATNRGGPKVKKPSGSYNPWPDRIQSRGQHQEWTDIGSSDSGDEGGNEWIDIRDEEAHDLPEPTARGKRAAHASSRGPTKKLATPSVEEDARHGEQRGTKRKRLAADEGDFGEIEAAKRKRPAHDDGDDDDAEPAALDKPAGSKRKRSEWDTDGDSDDRGGLTGRGAKSSKQLDKRRDDRSRPPRGRKAHERFVAEHEARAGSKGKGRAEPSDDEYVAPARPRRTNARPGRKHGDLGRSPSEESAPSGHRQLGGGHGWANDDDISVPPPTVTSPFAPMTALPTAGAVGAHATRAGNGAAVSMRVADEQALPRNDIGPNFNYSEADFLLDGMHSPAPPGQTAPPPDNDANMLPLNWNAQHQGQQTNDFIAPDPAHMLMAQDASGGMSGSLSGGPGSSAMGGPGGMLGDAMGALGGSLSGGSGSGAMGGTGGMLGDNAGALGGSMTDALGSGAMGVTGGMLGDNAGALGGSMADALGSGAMGGTGGILGDNAGAMGGSMTNGGTGSGNMGLSPLQLLGMGGVGLGNLGPMNIVNGLGGMMPLGGVFPGVQGLSPQQYQLLQAQQLAQLQAQAQAQLHAQLQAQAHLQAQLQAQAAHTLSAQQLQGGGNQSLPPWNGSNGGGHGM